MTAELEVIRVQPGELYFTRSPIILQTILGSCVSVTFSSRRRGIGGMCHGVLPRRPTGVGGLDAHRYVDSSIRHLIAEFDSLGVDRRELEVKLFGGADVLSISEQRAHKPTVGALNSRAALEVLAEENLMVMASDLGGTRGRTIQFNTASGEVLVYRLAKMNFEDTTHNGRSVRIGHRCP
jgi:chemotaxis protein CheD